MILKESHIQKIILVAVVVNSFVIFYFSWLPKPNMTAVPWLPSPFAKFLDIMALRDLRTSFPFISLGLLLFSYKIKPKYNYLKILLPLFIAITAETVQLFLPKRVYAHADIIWAIVGTILGDYLGKLIRYFLLSKYL